jgi:hypothetical protein
VTEKRKQFTCGVCKGVFDCGWTDDEARTELGENFPGIDVSACGVVCDDCYKIFEPFIQEPTR